MSIKNNANTTPSSSVEQIKEVTLTVENEAVHQPAENMTTSQAGENMINSTRFPVDPESKLAKVKIASRPYNWQSVVGAAAAAMIGTGANALVSNRLDEENKLSWSDIAILTGSAGVVGAGLQAALTSVPKINNNDVTNYVAMAFSANTAIVAETVFGNKLLGMLKGSQVDVSSIEE